MATGKRFYWMKLKESFMTSDTVDYFMSQPDGANYVVLYQMLCLKTINTQGRLERSIGEIIIPYDIEKIQRDCKWFSVDTVRIALDLYKAVGLIYVEDNGTLVLANHSELVGSETDWKEQKRLQRDKNLPKLSECKRMNESTIMLPTGKTQWVDEKRYGGNGMLAYDLAGGKCEMCGSYYDLLIHHGNGYSNDIDDLYILCKKCHGTAHAPSTPPDWLHHNRIEHGQDGGQDGGHVHTDIDIRDRDKISDINNNYKEKNSKKEKVSKFVPPTLEEVVEYCNSRNSPVNPKYFFEYFEAGHWIDSKGQQVLNWKQKLLTWERKGEKNDTKSNSSNGGQGGKHDWEGLNFYSN